MSTSNDDPRCPECGEPIGQTATYCMHCSADLTDERAAADDDGDGTWDGAEASSSVTDAVSAAADAAGSGSGSGSGSGDATADAGADAGGGQLVDDDGLLDDTLTVVVGIAGGVVVGVVGTVVIGFSSGSVWSLLVGVLLWLLSTAYLVRRRTFQEAISKAAYGVALVLLATPLIAFSPLTSVEGGLGGRLRLFGGSLLFVAIPAGIAAVVGWIAGRFVPDASG